MEEFKGYGNSVIIDGDNISVKQAFLKENFTFQDIQNVSYDMPTLMKNGCINLKTRKNNFKLFFTKSKAEEYKKLYEIFSNYFDGYKTENPDIELPIGTVIGITYLGGHPLAPKEGFSSATITTMNFTLNIGRNAIVIPMENIMAIHLETQDEIERRYTATRILTLGVFALAFKKKKKTTEKFFTLDFTDENGIENAILCSGNKCPQLHSLVYQGLSEYKKTHPVKKDVEVVQSSTSNLDEIKKLKELLDMDAITQEEFDLKKKELLGL